MPDRFTKAVWYIRNAPPRDSSNEERLKVYALFKQATVGDVQGSQPWKVEFEKRAKWDAWNELKGMSSEEAKTKYIEILEKGDAGWESSELLSKMPADWKVGEK
eukprot:GGOE01018219.1.p1 GENE.GGOE01018219.1~~GGOE01018219.1.p1  ORF type:complete len:116 (-),score=19.72 GGOE01018219.1:134-445(-)